MDVLRKGGRNRMINILILITNLLIVVLAVVNFVIYRLEKDIKVHPKLDKESKEYLEFVDLFKDNKIKSEGYVVVSAQNDDDIEEIMLHFTSLGSSNDYQKDKYILIKVCFSCHGMYIVNGLEEVLGRMASYDLIIDNVVHVSQIMEYYGQYGDMEDDYCVICTLKDGRKVEIIFNYKEGK